MNLFSVKYKMHRFVNIIFYFIVFALGFIAGGGNIEKISSIFNNIFN